jgi:5'-nucleotidase/UDP-sugar diphosphatase
MNKSRVFLVFSLLFGLQHQYVFADNNISIIFAAEMRDITDPVAGRYAELKTLVQSQRNHTPKTFLLFGGGSIGPSALSNLDRGAHIIDILNSVEPDAMGVSKREFTFSEDNLSLRA